MHALLLLIGGNFADLNLSSRGVQLTLMDGTINKGL